MSPVPVEVIPRVTGRVEWDQQRLDHAVSLWRDYDQVLADGLPKFPQALRPRVQAVMDRRLVNTLVWNIAHAIKPLPAEKSWQGPSENLVMSDVANLSQATQSLGLLIAAFNETGNVVQRDDLSDAVAGSSYDLLGRIEGLLAKDTLYLPLNSIESWQGHQPVTAVLFNAPDDVALQQYLSYQRERAHRLTNDYAAPVLAAIGMADTGRNSTHQALVQRWQRLYQDVDGYYKRRPGSTLVQLESFIRFGLADMRVGNCIDRLSAMEPIQASADYFLSRRTDILTQVMTRCDALNGGSGTLGNAYSQLADQFNTSLAGRYPFAASPDGSGLRAATPTDIRAFFVSLDSLRPRIEKDIKGGTMTTIQQMQVETFLSQIDAVRTFLAPVLDAKAGAPPGAYALDVDFRTNRAFEVNGNQILTWTVQIGAQKLQDPPLLSATPATPSAPQWHWGDPVSIRLQWAKDSPLQPQGVAGGQPSLDPPSTAVFSASDPWALVSLMRMQAIQAGQFDPALQPQPNVLALTVPTQAPGASGPPAVGQSTPAGAPQTSTQVFMRFGLSNASPPPGGTPAGDAETLVLPTFPTSAPVSGLTAGGR
jgi:type VI secretion system protein ImpL